MLKQTSLNFNTCMIDSVFENIKCYEAIEKNTLDSEQFDYLHTK